MRKSFFNQLTFNKDGERGTIYFRNRDGTLEKKAFEHNKIHCYTTYYLAVAVRNYTFLKKKSSFASLYKKAVKVGVLNIDKGIVLVE